MFFLFLFAVTGIYHSITKLKGILLSKHDSTNVHSIGNVREHILRKKKKKIIFIGSKYEWKCIFTTAKMGIIFNQNKFTSLKEPKVDLTFSILTHMKKEFENMLQVVYLEICHVSPIFSQKNWQ